MRVGARDGAGAAGLVGLRTGEAKVEALEEKLPVMIDGMGILLPLGILAFKDLKMRRISESIAHG
jgi:fumarate reductase subunit D